MHAYDLLPSMRLAVAMASRATRFVHASTAIEGASKDDRSPVTVADWASQAVVSIVLDRSGAGGIPLVGEEEASALRAPESAALRANVVAAVSHAIGEVPEADVLAAIDRGRADPALRFLTLDPVDGTKGFLRRQQYAISLGLIEHGVVTAGVVGCPNLPPQGGDYDRADGSGCVAFALRGGGAHLEDERGARRISIEDWRPGQPIRACESVESGHSKQDLSAELLSGLGSAGNPARLDSQCKYVVVARGGADIYMRLPVKADYREKIWDHAAGALVAAEAGARVCDVDGKPLDFGRGRELSANRGAFAGHPALVERLVAAYAARVR